MKFRASLTQRQDEIKGTIEFGPDPVFNLEAVLLVVEHLATTHQVGVRDVLTDMWRVYERQTENQ